MTRTNPAVIEVLLLPALPLAGEGFGFPLPQEGGLRGIFFLGIPPMLRIDPLRAEGGVRFVQYSGRIVERMG